MLELVAAEETTRHPNMNLNKLPTPASDIGSTRNVLSSDVEIEGELTFAEELLFDGKLKGEILSDGHLTVGRSARIEGDIVTKTVTVHGTVTGNITVTDRCELKASSTLTGDLKASRILIEEGATFIGKSEVSMSKTAIKTDVTRGIKPAASPALEPAGKR
jgi:cytoskeletal protein CcmA (bactofilin family)